MGLFCCPNGLLCTLKGGKRGRAAYAGSGIVAVGRDEVFDTAACATGGECPRAAEEPDECEGSSRAETSAYQYNLTLSCTTRDIPEELAGLSVPNFGF